MGLSNCLGVLNKKNGLKNEFLGWKNFCPDFPGTTMTKKNLAVSDDTSSNLLKKKQIKTDDISSTPSKIKKIKGLRLDPY
jgi:hypothetical protein